MLSLFKYARKETIMKFLIKKTPDGFIKSVNDEIASILNRNFDSFLFMIFSSVGVG